jgi:hypothetical protein
MTRQATGEICQFPESPRCIHGIAKPAPYQLHSRWGIDHDQLRGWQSHSLQNIAEHLPIPAVGIREMIMELAEVWRQNLSTARQVSKISAVFPANMTS